MPSTRIIAWRTLLAATAASAFIAHAQPAPAASGDTLAEVHAGMPGMALDSAAAERILALDPEHLSERDVRDVLSLAPAPRIIALQGSLALVTMEPFADFLIAMGYPEERITNPADGTRSYSSFRSSAALAGTLAWHYEREGMMPMLIGHSQGGMLAIRILHELAGGFADAIPVWSPLTDAALPRTSIVDPVDGRERPVVGLKVPYAAAIATGVLPRIVLGQWTMIAKLRQVPDSVGEFTGFAIAWDLIAGNLASADPYVPTGSAVVRNVTLPASYSHVGVPSARHLAENEATRAWISAYAPGTDRRALPDDTEADTTNILHAADIWYSVKKHWCVEAQRLIRARRTRA